MHKAHAGGANLGSAQLRLRSSRRSGKSFPGNLDVLTFTRNPQADFMSAEGWDAPVIARDFLKAV